LVELLCGFLELLAAFWLWLAEFCPWLPAALLRLEVFCAELRVELPLSLVFALVLELEDWVEALSEAPSAPNEECDADEGEGTGVERIESRAT
jgi:hypothetical protein